MVRLAGLFALILALFLMPQLADGQLRLEGDIRIVGSDDAGPVMLSVNDMTPRAIEDGRFDLTLPDAEHYALRFSGDGIFTAVQTFSAREVAQGPLPTIEIVGRKPGRVEMIFGGDVMAGRRYLEPVWGERRLIHDESRLEDMKALLAPMKPYFETADLASLNLESILSVSEPKDAAPKSVVFYTHPDFAEALLWMGVDHVSLGNNHVYDYLEPGLEMTMAALDAAGLPHSGAGRNSDSAIAASRFTLGGTSFDLAGAVGWAGRVEPNQIAEEHKGGAAHGTQEVLRAMASAAYRDGTRAIIQYHGNREYSDGPTDIGETRLYAAADAGAPLIIGHHPHVAQGFEVRNGRLIAWSLGNFLFDQYFMETHRAAALKVWLDDGEFYRAEAIPLQILDYRPVPATDGQRRAIMDRLARLSAERGTVLGQSGGHLTVGAAVDAPYAYGLSDRNLFPRGDFEATRFASANDRSWHVEGGRGAIVGGPDDGYALKLMPDDRSCSVAWTTKTFFRVVQPGEHRLTAELGDLDAGQVSMQIQLRPQGMGRFDALETAPWRPVDLQIEPKDDQQRLIAHFSVPAHEGRALPFRIRMTFDNACGGLSLDNVAITHNKP